MMRNNFVLMAAKPYMNNGNPRSAGGVVLSPDDLPSWRFEANIWAQPTGNATLGLLCGPCCAPPPDRRYKADRPPEDEDTAAIAVVGSEPPPPPPQLKAAVNLQCSGFPGDSGATPPDGMLTGARLVAQKSRAFVVLDLARWIAGGDSPDPSTSLFFFARSQNTELYTSCLTTMQPPVS